MMAALGYAPSAFRALNGIFCVYKPPGSTMRQIKATIPMRLAAGKYSSQEL
jgi:hypothetical protein